MKVLSLPLMSDSGCPAGVSTRTPSYYFQSGLRGDGWIEVAVLQAVNYRLRRKTTLRVSFSRILRI
jgi:hypothetical protein